MCRAVCPPTCHLAISGLSFETLCSSFFLIYPLLLCRYAFFQHSPLLGDMRYETEFDFNGTRVYVTSCMVEG